ncbi:MAG TPA: XdhC family protein [Acidimicrobiia bacterium]|nr:XdhC family protein [Acidimicrobiia bacterium]
MTDQVLQTVPEWLRRQIPFVLATVVGVRGSTYRGLGARQLISRDGSMVGTVSGGCLDSELIDIAAAMKSDDPPRIVEFDLTADDEEVWGWGIGCNGVTQLLVEPAPAVRSLTELIDAAPPGILHTLSGPHLGAHVGIGPDDEVWGADLIEARREGRHRRVHRRGVDYLLEVVSGRTRLIVCGAGHDAVPLVRLGKELGFETTVVDDRRAFLTHERFPEADRLVQCAPADLTDHIEVDDGTNFVIMSHNYLRDVDYLGSLIGKGAAYIGCLGPGERLERMLKDLSGRGIEPGPTERIFGPAGLDLGADGPTEIAWAILSEILTVRRQRRGGFLVEKKGPPNWRPLG